MRPQVDPLLGAHTPAPSKTLHHNRTLEDQLLSCLVSKGYCPTSVLIEAIQCLDEVTIEGVATHLSIGNDIDASILLERDGLVHCPIFYGFELRRVELPSC